MRKASRIIYLVAAILSIFAALGYIGWGVFCIVGANTEVFIEGVIEGYNKNPAPGVDALEFLAAAQALVIYCGVCLLISAACAGVNSFLAFKAHHEAKPSKALNVLNIVFSVLGGVFVNVVAAIFAFIADHQEAYRAIEEKK